MKNERHLTAAPGKMKPLILLVLLEIACLTTVFAQNNTHGTNTLTGVVLDESNAPIIGATVVIKGTVKGASTDVNGEFIIVDAAGDNVVLQISSLGYLESEVKVGNRTHIAVTLKEDSQVMDEVVVVGYGSQRKANLSGAVDQVTSEVFNGRPVANTTQMLQGAVPNLNISLADGKPNRSANYNIRGVTSIGAGGSALILIDGVEGDPAMLNPNDIESVSVLKDAASSAIYGSRAPYGVVLITTKDPSKQKDSFKINYSANIAFQQPTATMEAVSDGYVYARLFEDAWYNYRFNTPTTINTQQDFSKAWLDEFKSRKLAGNSIETVINNDGTYSYFGSTDYYDALYKDVVTSRTHNISLSVSNGKLNQYFSARLYDYDGLFNFTPDTYRTMNIRHKASAQVADWLKFTNNFDYTYDKYIIPIGAAMTTNGNVWNIINNAGHPSVPIFNPDGTMTLAGATAMGGLITGNNWYKRNTNTLKNTTSVNMSFLDNKLRVSGDFSFRNTDYSQTRKQTAVPYSTAVGKTSYLGTPETGDYITETAQFTNYIVANAYTEYENTFADKHYFKVLLGYNYEQQDYKSTVSQRYGLIMPDVENINFATGEVMSISGNGTRWRYVGTFFRLNYSYDNRYLLEVNGRYDGSSKFPNNSQWGFFPSASAAWRLSQEEFWNIDPQVISNVKLRASYGSLGNSNVSPYSYLETFAFKTFDTSGGSTSRYLDGKAKLRYTSMPSQIPDNLSWETSNTIDGGIDLGFCNDKITLTADYYIRKTYDMYTVGPTLPDTYGAESPKGNYASMSTCGYEFSLAYNDRIRIGGDYLTFGIKATLADYYSIINSYNNPSRKLSDYYEGQRVGEIWGYVCNGLFQTQEEISGWWDGKGYKNNIMQTSVNYTTYPGDMIIEDLNNNQEIDYGTNTVDDPGDRTIIGNSQPRYIYSFSLNAEYRNFYFSTMFDGVGKQDWYPSSESIFWGQYNRPYNQALAWHIGNYWTEDNRDAYLPRYVGYYGPMKSGIANTRYLQNIAYLRLKNLQIGYNLPQKWVKALKLSGVSVYFSGENLYTWSPVYNYTRDFDVTVVSKDSDTDITSENKGDGYNYPIMRSFSFGLSITY